MKSKYFAASSLPHFWMVVVMARLLLLLIVGLMGDSHYRDRSEEEIKEKLDAIIKQLNERERSD